MKGLDAVRGGLLTATRPSRVGTVRDYVEITRRVSTAPSRSPVQFEAALHCVVSGLSLAALWALLPSVAEAQTLLATVTAAPIPISITLNPTTSKIYVVSFCANGVVTEIDGDTNAATTIPVGSYPYGIDVNTVTNKIYVTNSFSNSVTVIDGATRATTTIAHKRDYSDRVRGVSGINTSIGHVMHMFGYIRAGLQGMHLCIFDARTRVHPAQAAPRRAIF